MAHRPTESDLARIVADVGRGESSLAELMGMSPAVTERLVERALGCAEAGRLDEAERLLSELALVHAESAMLQFLLGTVRAEQGEYSAAVSAYDEALDRHVREGGHARFESEVRLQRARALMGVGRRDDAQVDLLLAAVGPDLELSRGAQALLTGLAGIDR